MYTIQGVKKIAYTQAKGKINQDEINYIWKVFSFILCFEIHFVLSLRYADPNLAFFICVYILCYNI